MVVMINNFNIIVLLQFKHFYVYLFKNKNSISSIFSDH